MSSMSSELVHYRNLFLMIFVLGIGGTFQYGYHMSVMNSPSPFIKQFINDTLIRRYRTSITDGSLTLIWSLVISIFSIGGLTGSTASGYLTGRFGKKKCQLCNAVLPMISAVLMSLSKIFGYFEMVVAARFLSGFYAGLGINIHAQYVGETAPRKLRGFINATGPLFVTLGKLCGQMVGLREIFGTELLWPQVLLFSGITSLVQLVALPFFPESPTYLLLVKGDKEGCLQAREEYLSEVTEQPTIGRSSSDFTTANWRKTFTLKQLWGDRDHQPVIDEMLKEQNTQSKGKHMGVLDLLKDPSQRYQLLAMIGLILSLQLSGANAIYFYAYDVFQEAGFPEDQIAYVSLGVGTFEFISAMICSLLIDRFGRRFLMLGGYSLMGLTLGLLTVTLALQDAYFWMPYCSVGLTFTFIFLYGAGPAGATISTCVEIFAQAPRVPAFVISGVFSWVGLYILGMIFPYIVETLQHFCFLLFLVVIIISGTVIYLLIPETKGKSIAEISQEFNKLNFRRQHMEGTTATSEIVLCSRL